jgi:hypothetical protein
VSRREFLVKFAIRAPGAFTYGSEFFEKKFLPDDFIEAKAWQ